MESCQEPYCVFSNYRKKCVKPNPYIEEIAWCKRNNKEHKNCKIEYALDKQNAKDLACDRYYERMNIKKKPKCVDPKCHFSEKRQKCVKPNPYIEKVAYCGRIKTKRPECEGDYRLDKEEAKLNACKRYNERILLNATKPIKVKKEPKVKKNIIPVAPIPKKILSKVIPVVPKKHVPAAPHVPAPASSSSASSSPAALSSPASSSRTSPARKSSSPASSKVSPVVPKKSSSNKSSITPLRALKIKSFIEKRAAKKIQKLTMPFINRVSANIDHRIKYALLLNKYLENINIKQCLTKIGDNQYSLENQKIKLMKQIGSNSKYGAIYMSKGTNEGELYRFAVKIMKQTKDNKYELLILQSLTKLVLQNKNPHFPIIYKNYQCDIKTDKNTPEIVSGSAYYISLNEIATGDLNKFMHLTKTGHSEEILLNTIAQIMMAIFSFHKLGYYHNDAHYGNFLYHRINPGGFLKYSIYGEDYYIENLGYLWIIWDFGKSTLISKDPSNSFTLNFHFLNDYFRIIYAFINEGDRLQGWIEDNYFIPAKINTMILRILGARKYIIDSNFTKTKNGEKLFITELIKMKLFKKLEDIPPNSKIINQNAYVII